MGFFKAGDAISGQEGRAYATIDGRVEEMFYAKTIEATAEKTSQTSRRSVAVGLSPRQSAGLERGA